MKLFSIYDSQAEAYYNPLCYNNEKEAIRAFQLACHDPQHPFYRTPADYTLFYLGDFIPEDAAIQLKIPKVALMNGVEAIQTTPLNVDTLRLGSGPKSTDTTLPVVEEVQNA